MNAKVWSLLFLWGFFFPFFGKGQPDYGTAAAHTARYRPDRVLVLPKSTASPAQRSALHEKLGARLLRRLNHSGDLEVVKLPAGLSVTDAVARYRSDPLVAAVEPDYIVHATLAPNDPGYLDGTQWGLNNWGQSGGTSDADIDAPEAWDSQITASNVIVAVIDSGVRYTHEDLAANMWVNAAEIPGNGVDDDHDGTVDDVHGLNALAGTGDPMDDHGHGTHVAGIIGAVGNNAKGGAGIAWHVKIMACKFMDNTGNGSISDAIECIDYARLHGAKIINASWGGPDVSFFLQNAINKARSAGVIFVAAAGNDAQDTDSSPNYPSSFTLDNIVAVAATTRNDTLASYSNYGATSVDLAAPGSSIYSTYKDSDSSYIYMSGTSMATPHVSGAMALMMGRYPNDDYRQLISRLLAATDPTAGLAGKCVSGGRLNLGNAIGPALQADFSATPPVGEFPLTTDFSDQSQGSVVGWNWDFGDGSSQSTTQNPTHVFNSEGQFNVTLTVTSPTGATSSKTLAVAAESNYRVFPADFAWIDPAGMPTISLSDDGVSSPLLLPFTFRFYGRDYDQIYVGANGVFGFLAAGLDIAANGDLPSTNAPNSALFPYWDDLNPAAGGAVRVGATGAAPARQVVISWVGVPLKSDPAATMTFQAVLDEARRLVKFQYLDVSPSQPTGAGLSATIGLEDGSGSLAARYSFDGSSPLTNQQAIVFAAGPVGVLVVSPENNWDCSGLVGGPFAPDIQSYTVQNAGNGNLDWQFTNTASWISVSATSGTLWPGASTNLTAAITASADFLSAGDYSSVLAFTTSGHALGDTTRQVTLTANAAPGYLSVGPAAGLHAVGPSGGPFTPLSGTYGLTNSGGTAIDWSASADQDWLTISPGTGTLAAGQRTNVVVSFNSLANGLSPGTYSSTARFANVSNGTGDTTRSISLDVIWPPNQPPVVSLTGPVDGAEFTAPATILLEADAIDSDGTIAQVEFYEGTNLLRSVTSAPYEFGWSNVVAGSYSLSVVAIDNDGRGRHRQQ